MKRRSIATPAIDRTYGAIGITLGRVVVGDEAREGTKGGAEVGVEGVTLVTEVFAEVVHCGRFNREVHKMSMRLRV